MPNQTIQAAIKEFFQTKSIKKQMDVLKALQKHKEALQGLSGLGEADIVQIVVGRAISGDKDLTGFINHMINHFFKKGQGGLTAFNDSVKPAGGILSRVISGRTSLPPLEEALIENMERTVQGQINDESLYSNDGDRKLDPKKTYTENMFVSGREIKEIEYKSDGKVYGRYGIFIDPITGGDPGELVELTDANGHMLPGFSKDKIAQHNAKVDREAEIKDQEAELTQSKIKLEAIKQTLETKYGKDCFAYIDDLASSATDPSSVASFKENIEKIRDLQGKFRESLKDQMNEMTLVLEKAARTHHKGKFTREELQDAVSSEYSLPIKDDIMQRFLLKKLEAVETPATITDALRGINSELADDIISEKNKGTTERRYFSGIPEMSREIVQTKEISTGAEVDNLLLTYLGTNPSEKLDKFAKSMRNYMELYPAGERNTKVSLIVEMSKDQLEELNKMTDLGEIHAFSTEYDVAFNFAQLPTDVQKAVKAALNTRSIYFRLPLTFFDARMNELKGKLESTALKENFKDIYECSPVDFIERIKEQIDLADEGAYDFYIEVTQDMQKSLDGLKQIHKKVVENKPLTPNERKIYEGFEEDAAAKYFEYYTSSDSHKQQDQMTTYIEAQDRDLTELNSSLENGKRIYSSQSKVKQASAEVAKARSQHVKAPDHISYYPETVRKFTGQTPLIDDSLDSIKQSLIDEKKRLKAIAQQNSNAPKNFSAVSKKGEFKKQMNSISRSIHTWPIPTNYDAVITDLDNLISKVSAATSPLGRIDLLAPAHDTTHMNQTDIGRIGAQAKNLKSHLQCLRSIKNIDDAINEIDQTKKSLQTDTSVSESVSELRDAILSTGNKYADLKDVFSTLRTLEEISAYDIHLDTDSGMDFIEPSMPNAKSATDTAIKNIENILPIVKSSEVKHSMQIQLNKLKKTKEAIEAFNNSKQTYIATAGEASTLFKTLFDKSILPLSRGDETRGKEKAQQKFLFLCAKYLSGMEDGASYKTVENDLEFAYEQVQNLLSVSDQTDGFKRRTAETSNISSSAKNDIQEFKKLSTLVKHVVAQRKATLDLYDEASIQGNASEGGMTTYQDNQLMSELRSVTDIVIRNKGTEDYAQFCSTEAKDKSVTFSTGLDSKTADTMAKSMRKMQANFAKNRKQSKKSFDAINKLVSGTAYDIRQKSLADVDGKSNGSIDFLKESLNKFAAAALSDKNTSDKLEAFVGNLKADKKYQDLKPSTSFPEYKKSIADCGDDTAKEKYQECGYSSERVIASLFSRKNLQTAESYGLDLKAIKQLDTKWISTLRDNFLKKIEKSYAFPLKREDIVSKEGVAKKTYIEKLSEYEEKIKDYNEAIKTREDAVKSLSKGRLVKPGSPYNSAAQEHACLAWDAYQTLKDDEEMTLDQLQAHIASTPGMVQLREVLGIPTIVNGTMRTYPDYIKNLYDDLIAAEKVLTYCRGEVNEAQGREELGTPSTVPEPKNLLQSAFPRKKDSVLSHLSGYKSLKKQKSEIQTAWNFDVLKSKIGEFLAGMKFSPKDTTEKDLKAIEQILEGIKGKITTMKDVYPKSDYIQAIAGLSLASMDKAEEIFTAVNELDPYKGFDRSRPADVKGLVEDMQQLNKLVGNVKVKQRKAAQEKLDSQLEDKKKQTIVEMKKQHANELADSKNAYEESAKEQIFDPLFSDKGFDVLMRVNGSKGIKKGVDRNRISPVVKEWAAETKQPISDGEKRSLSTRLNEIMKAEETNSEKSRTRSKLAIYDDLPEPLRLKLQTNAAVRDKFKGTLIKFYQNEAQNKGLEGNLADFYSSMLGGSSLSKDEIKKYLKSGENLSEKAAFDKAMANLVAVTYDSTIATATDTATATATAESALKALQAKCDQNEKIKNIQGILKSDKVDNIKDAIMLREHLVSQYAKRYSLPKKHKHTTMPNRLKGMEAAKYDPAVLKGIQITNENLPQVGPLLIKALEDDKANLIHRKHRDYWVSQIQHAAVTSDKEEHFFKADLEKLGYDATDIHDLAENIDAINYDYSLDVLEKLKEFEDAMKYRGSTNDTRTRFTNRSSTDEEIKTKYNKIQRDVASVRASIIDKLKNGTGLSLIKPALEKAIKDCKGGIRRGIQRTSREDIIDTLKDHINPPSNPATP